VGEKRKKRSRLIWLWGGLLGVTGLLVVLILVLSKLLFQPRSPEPVTRTGPLEQDVVSTEWVSLYFSDPNTGKLVPETREIVALDNRSEKARMIVEELLAGPRSKLVPTLPNTAKIRDVYLDKHGRLYLDFSNEFISGQVGGTSSELETIGSIIKTISHNLPGIIQVQLLVDGKEIPTLAGHIKADAPFSVLEWQ